MPTILYMLHFPRQRTAAIWQILENLRSFLRNHPHITKIVFADAETQDVWAPLMAKLYPEATTSVCPVTMSEFELQEDPDPRCILQQEGYFSYFRYHRKGDGTHRFDRDVRY